MGVVRFGRFRFKSTFCLVYSVKNCVLLINKNPFVEDFAFKGHCTLPKSFYILKNGKLVIMLMEFSSSQV